MTSYIFNDQNIHWQTFGDFKHIVYSILDIDIENTIADVIFKFDAHKQIFLHRHKALNKSLVIQGEHRIYNTHGELKEVRGVGSFTNSPASEEPHRECGGDGGAVVLFSIRGELGALYEILDEQQNIVETLSFNDLTNLFEANQNNNKHIKETL